MDVQALYDAHKNTVYRLALTFLKSVPDAEDAVQQVFLKLIEQQHRITPGKEKAWLATVTANFCRDMLRSAARKPTETIDDAPLFEDSGHQEVLRAVMQLSANERAAVYLYYYEGYDTREIGRILGISLTAVTSRLARARQHLKEELQEVPYD